MVKSKYKELRRLPNGGLTDKVNDYVDAWNDYAKPMEVFLGLQMHSCDPDVGFRDIYHPNCVVQLPRWFINKFNDLVNNKFVPKLGHLEVKLKKPGE